jgi:hypothetical protein
MSAQVTLKLMPIHCDAIGVGRHNFDRSCDTIAVNNEVSARSNVVKPESVREYLQVADEWA